ncbi:MAG: thiazole synthase [Candidatus Omnitrophica bacterium]|nr:thiazole synthase [Candidatus Omnitrophota bacterium]
MADDILSIGGEKIGSRLFIGTGKFSDERMIKDVISASGAQVITVALRRVDAGVRGDNVLEYIPQGSILMTNTSGARNADEAVRIARIARAAGCGNWIKIEVINDNRYLLPDNLETLKAVEVLVKEGFIVLPYMNPDLVIGRRLLEAGAAAVMPLGSPIGSNRGLRTEEIVKIMARELKGSVIVDAGLGAPSDAARCMEMGCAAVLVNTAIAVSPDPANMARAFSEAVIAGRRAYIAGLAPSIETAEASSPLTGFLGEE